MYACMVAIHFSWMQLLLLLLSWRRTRWWSCS